MANQLLEPIEYKIDKTKFGSWRRYGYIDGSSYHEFTSHISFFGLPLIHYTQGRNPETGRRRVAKGVIAVGRLAFGIIAIGHASLGLIAIGQLAVGVIFGLGQLATGAVAIAQIALALIFGFGQFATGYVAIGQFVYAYYGLAQFGLGKYIHALNRSDLQAVEFFKSMILTKPFMP